MYTRCLEYRSAKRILAAQQRETMLHNSQFLHQAYFPRTQQSTFQPKKWDLWSVGTTYGTLTCFPARGREQDELFPWDIVSLSFPPAENSKSCPHLCYKNSLCSRHHSLHRTNSKGAIKFSLIGNLPSPNNAAHSVATLVASRCYFSSIAKS